MVTEGGVVAEAEKKGEEGAGFLGDIMDSARKAAEDAVDAAKGAATSVGDAVSNPGSIIDGAKKAAEDAGTAVSGAVSNPAGAAGDSAEAAKGFLGGIWTQAQEAAEKAQAAALEAAETAKKAAEDATAKAQEAASSAQKGIGLGGEGGEVAKAGEGGESSGFFTGMWENAAKAAQDAQKSALEAAEHYKKAAEEAAENAKKAAEEAAESAKKGVTSVTGGSDSTDVVKSDDGQASNFFSDMWSTAQKAAEDAQKAAVTAAEEAQKAATAAAEQAKKAAEDAAGAAENAAKSAGKGLTGGAEGDEQKKEGEGDADAPKKGMLSGLFGSKKKEGDAKDEEGAVVARGEGEKGLVGNIWGTLVSASEQAVSAANVAAEAAKNAAETTMTTAKSGLDQGVSMSSSITGPISGGLSSITSLAQVPTINMTGYSGKLCTEATPLVSTTIKVATLSVWRREFDYEKRQNSIISTLKALNADVICLQDVWKETDKDGKSQAQIIAEALEYKFAYEGKKAEKDSAGVSCTTGSAILSRWPVASSSMKALAPGGYDDEGRLVMRAELEGPRGAIVVYCASLNSKLGQSDSRIAQVKEVCNFIKSAKTPAPKDDTPSPLPVLCGCFNASPDSDEIRMLTGKSPSPVKDLVFIDSWEAAGSGAGETWSNSNGYASAELLPSIRSSYVFSCPPSAGGRGHVTGASLFANSLVPGVNPPSNHYGVLAEIRY